MFLEKEMVHGNYYQQNLKHFVKAVLISVLKFAKKRLCTKLLGSIKLDLRNEQYFHEK